MARRIVAFSKALRRFAPPFYATIGYTMVTVELPVDTGPHREVER
jgi:hypothetical protein